MRFLRGLTIGLSLSVLNLAGVFLTLLALGGLGEWTSTQFVGMFGTFEIATGIAFIFCPNAWRMPVVDIEAERTTVRLTASTLFIPHWAGGAKVLAGALMLFYAAANEGLDRGTIGVGPFVLSVAVLTVAASVLAAAWGVRNPSLDVVYFKVIRPYRPDIALPGMSLSAMLMQIILGAFTLPTIKLLDPGVFFRPEVGPTVPALAVTLSVTAAVVLATSIAWRGRIGWRADPEQQDLAEQPA